MKASAFLTLWLAQVAWALPKKELRPSEIFLKNLPTDKLDSLLEARLQDLKNDIVKSYETQLRDHETNLENLHRYRRDKRTTISPQLATKGISRHLGIPSYWHSYTFDVEIGNREKLTITDIDVKDRLGNVKIIKVFPLDLWNISAIYQCEAHLGHVIKDGRLETVKVRNRWTKSLVGCPCDHDHSKDCACCEEGACRCGSASDTCVPCDKDYYQTCDSHRPKKLELDAAVGFQYYLNYYDPEEGLQRVLVAARGTTVTFYKIDEDSAQTMHSESGLGTIIFATPVTHLGYGETFKDFHGIIKKDRFLITFRAGENSQQFHGINIDATGIASGLSEVWHAVGSEMRAWQSGGRVMLAVLSDAELLIYELKANQWHEYRARNLQTLSLGTSIVYWQSFCMGFENYLVVVTRKAARLYLHSGMLYHGVQDLSPSHGISFFRAIVPLSIPSWKGKAVLLTGEAKKILAYVWNDTQMVQMSYVKDLEVSISDWYSVYAHADMKLDSNLVVVPTGLGLVRLEVKAVLEDLPDPVIVQTQELQNMMNSLEVEFQRQSNVIVLAQERLSHTIDGHNTINADITIVNGIVVNETLDTGELNADTIRLEQVTSDGQVIYQGYRDHMNRLGYYDRVLDTLNTSLSSLHAKLDDAVPASGTNRLISGTKTLVQGGLRINTLSADHITVGKPLDVNGNLYPLDDILQGLVRYNDTRTIAGRKTLLNTLTVGNLYTDLLDDVPVSDLVTTDGSDTIVGASFLNGLRANIINVTPGGMVGGIDLSEEAVLLTGEARLGSCTFKSDLWVTDMLAMSNVVSGVNIERLSKNALTTRGGIILGSLEFLDTLSIHTLDARYIMGVDTVDFMSTTVFKNKSSVIRGSLMVPSMEIHGDLIVKGKINGKNFPNDYPLKTDSTLNFGAKRFKDVYFDTLRVGPQCLVDGLPLNQLVTLHTPQTITGEKTFAKGVYIKGDLEISSKIIDGVNLDELNASLSYISTSDWQFDVIFKKPVQAPSLSFGGTLNALDWADLVSDIIYDDEDSAVITSHKNFKLGVSFSNAVFKSTFNGESFSNLVTIDSSHSISGRKVFKNDVSFGSLTVGLLDGVDLEKLVQSAVYLDKEGQVVRGRKTFTRLSSKDLVTEGIENFDIRNVVTKSTDQTFTASQSLHSVVFSSLQATSINLATGFTVNTVDIPRLQKSHVSLISPTYHTGKLIVQGPVSVLGKLSVGTINGKDINVLMNNLVMKDESSIITADLTFTDLTVQGPVTTYQKAGANGLNISNIDLNAVKLTGNTVMTGAATWGQVLLQEDVSVGGLVNGVDLLALSQDLIYKDVEGLQVITGKKTFQAGMTVQGDIEASFVNGIDLRKSMLTRHTVQSISGPYILNNVEARGTVNILGLYNQVNLTSLASDRTLWDEDTIYGNVTFFGDVNSGQLHIEGIFNGVDIEKRLADSVLVNDLDTVITGKKTFLANTTTFRNLRVHTLNSIPLDTYLKHVVLKNGVSTLGQKIVVQGSITSPSITANTITVQGTVDGVDYTKFLSEAVYLHKNQTINSNLVFIRDLNVHGDIWTGQLNGMNLERDFLTTDTEQTIRFSVTFGNITTGDVAVGGRVNSWYLPDEVANTMKTTGGQTLTGRIIMKGSVEVLGDVTLSGLVGTTVKVDISEDSVQLHQDNEIHGSLVFMQPVIAETVTSVPGIVSGVNIPELFRNAWYLDKATDITGAMIFNGPVILLEALLRNQSMSSLKVLDLQRNMTQTLETFNTTTTALERLYKETCPPVVSLYRHLERAIFEADHFASVYEYLTPYRRHSSVSFSALNNTYVVVSWEGGRCDSTIYTFIPHTTTMTEIALGDSGYAHHWLFLGAKDNQVYLAMAASSSDNDCERQTSVIWKVTEDATFVVHQELLPGTLLSSVSDGTVVTLYVHDADISTIYTLNLSSGNVKKVTDLSLRVDTAATLTMANHTHVTFMSHEGLGTVRVNGVPGTPSQIAKKIDDGILLQHGGKVFLLLAVTRIKMHREQYFLELYSVDLKDQSLTWLDIHVMAAKLKVTAFFAGVETTGSYIIIALQESRVPLVYTLLGETLKEMAQLSTPRVEWIQHVKVNSHNMTGIVDHYLLLGQTDRTTVLARLVMRGAALPKKTLSCNLLDANNLI